MEIHATCIQKVEINPKDVIEKLISDKIGRHGWVFEKDGKYYEEWEESAGSHSFDEKKEIDKELFDYIKALQLVLKYLNK